MTTAELKASAFVHDLERGWYPGHLSSDPNPTLDGVTQATYSAWRKGQGLPDRSVREMAEAERLAIYHEYWVDCRADAMPEAVAAIHFAYAFNAGPSAAARPLQRAVGVHVDGIIGPKTLAAVNAAPPAQLVPVLLVEQAASYHDIAIRKKHLRPNMTSWIGRLATGWHRFGGRSWGTNP